MTPGSAALRVGGFVLDLIDQALAPVLDPLWRVLARRIVPHA